MILQSNRHPATAILLSRLPIGRTTNRIFRALGIGCAQDFNVIKNKYAVVKHCNKGGCFESAVRSEDRCRKNNIVALPLSWWFRHIHQGCVLQIDRTGLTIYIGWVLPAIEYLHFE